MYDQDHVTATVDTVVDMLRSGSRSRDEVVAALAEAGLGAAELDGDDEEAIHAEWEAWLGDVILSDPRFVGGDDRVGFAPALFDGVVVCHRVTAGELARGVVSIERNLGVLDWGVPPGSLTVGGTPAEVDGPDLVGPDGWLDGIEAEEILAFLRRGSDLIVERAPALGDGSKEADALVAAAEVLGTEHGIEMTSLLSEAILADPTLFRTSVPPVSELLWARGMERRRHLWGFSDQIWQPRYARDEASGAVEILLAAYEDGVRDDLAAASDLADDAIGGLLELADRHEAATVEALLAVPTLSSPARSILEASLAERAGDPVSAQATLGAVWEEHRVRAIGARLSEYALWAGELVRARSLAEEVGDQEQAAACERISRGLDGELRRVPRNARCPCGSGQKFKKCCLPTGTLAASPRLAAALVRAKLFVTVGMGMPGVLGDQMVIDQARYHDLGHTRAPLLPPAERELFDAVLTEPVRVWELVDRSGRWSTMRAGDVEVEVVGITGAVGDRALARILSGHGVLYGELHPLGADDVADVAAALGPEPRSAQVSAALALLE